MCAERAWRFRLEHIIDAIDRILRYTHGMAESDFRTDERTFDAVIRNFEVIGEATRHVPQDVRAQFTAVPWSLMERMRHILAHDYDVVDPEIVWRTIHEDLVAVRGAVQDAYQKTEP